MKLTCSNCRREILLEDAKLPAGPFQVKCPQCSQTIQSRNERNESAVSAEEISPATARYIKRELEALKRELLQAIGSQPSQKIESNHRNIESIETNKSALLCESGTKSAEEISRILKNMGYTVERAATKEEADRKIEAGFYALILLDSVYPDDKDGGQKLLAMINGQKSAQRRQTFVVLLSATLKTTGAESAFLQGANLVLNKEDVKQLEPLLRDGQKNFQQMYSVLNSLILEKNMR